MATPPITAADIPALDNDPALIRSAARALGRIGPPTLDHATATMGAWRAAEAAYAAPEAPVLLAALDPNRPVAERVADRVRGAEQALLAYADAAEPCLVELRRLLATEAASPEAAAETQARIRQLAGELLAAEQACEAALKTLAVDAGAVGATLTDRLTGPVDRLAGLPAPPAGGSPADVNRWWQSLGPEGQAAYLAAEPGLVGNLNGVPAADRDRANRALLALEIFRLEDRRQDLLAQIGAQPAEGYHPYGGVPTLLTAAQLELAETDARLGALQRVENRLDAVAQDRAYLLGFAPQLGTGQAIVAIGDPDRAQNVVTQVPGTNTDLNDLDGEIGRAEAVLDAARQIAPEERTAVVAWLGYDAPVDAEAALADQALAAREPLRDFTDGLRATHAGPPSLNTLIGHSYGSTVIGQTAASGRLDADRIVAVGSPGVGLGVNDVADLHRPPGTVYATTSPSDPIRHVTGTLHGPSPSNPYFGSRVFPADPDGGHSDYWRQAGDRPNQSLVGIGRIVTGYEP